MISNKFELINYFFLMIDQIAKSSFLSPRQQILERRLKYFSKGSGENTPLWKEITSVFHLE